MSWNQVAGPARGQGLHAQYAPGPTSSFGGPDDHLSLDSYVALDPATAAGASHNIHPAALQPDDLLESSDTPSATGGTRPGPLAEPLSREEVFHWIQELHNGANREQALAVLGKNRELFGELALVLWHSFGTMTILLQELVSVYPSLSLPQLATQASNRVCNALSLLQCVASHDATRPLFLKANIPMYLYPFLNTTAKTRAFEYLRLTSLGVIGALVKNDSSDVVNFLLSTEIIPLCLRMIETGSELSKTVAIFIVQRIITDDLGLTYVCQTYERFFAVSSVLANVVQQLTVTLPGSARLLKHVIRCYLRLSDDPRARESLRQCLPESLRDATFSALLRNETATRRCLAQLLTNLANDQGGAGSLPGMGQPPSGGPIPGLMPGVPSMSQPPRSQQQQGQQGGPQGLPRFRG